MENFKYQTSSCSIIRKFSSSINLDIRGFSVICITIRECNEIKLRVAYEDLDRIFEI